MHLLEENKMDKRLCLRGNESAWKWLIIIITGFIHERNQQAYVSEWPRPFPEQSRAEL